MADDIGKEFAALRKALTAKDSSERDVSLELAIAIADITETVVRDLHDIAEYARAHAPRAFSEK